MRRNRLLRRSAVIGLAAALLLTTQVDVAAAGDNPRKALVGRSAPQAGPVSQTPPTTAPAKAGEFASLSFGVQAAAISA